MHAPRRGPGKDDLPPGRQPGRRPAAVALIPVMFGALLVHVPNGWMFSGPGGGWEYPAFLIVALAAPALLGPGALAVRVPAPGRPADLAVGR